MFYARRFFSVTDWELRSDRNDGTYSLYTDPSVTDWELRSDRNNSRRGAA